MKLLRKKLVVILMFAISLNAFSDEITKYVCNGWGIDVYEDADITSNVVAHIPFGESVLIKAETDIQVQNEGEGYWWKKISFNNVTGYVSSKWLVNSFETAVKINRIEGTWVRYKWECEEPPLENEYLSFVYSGKDEQALFIINGSKKISVELINRFFFEISEQAPGYFLREEQYFYTRNAFECVAMCFQYEWQYDKDGKPVDNPIKAKWHQEVYYYRKINFHEDFDSVYRLKSDYKTYRTIASEIFKIYDNPNLSGRIASVIGPGTAIEVIDVPERNGEALAGWVKVAVLKPLKTGGYEKTDIVGWCYWEQ